MNELTEFLSRKEVCDILQISERTLERIMNAGHLACYKVGRQIRFRKNDVESYLNAVRVNETVVRPRPVMVAGRVSGTYRPGDKVV